MTDAPFQVEDFAFMLVWPPFKPDDDPTVPQLMRFHGPALCAHQGINCCIHKQSDHHMATWPQVWRTDHRIVVRRCEHGQHHPDPDDLSAWQTLCDCTCRCCGR